MVEPGLMEGEAGRAACCLPKGRVWRWQPLGCDREKSDSASHVFIV